MSFSGLLIATTALGSILCLLTITNQTMQGTAYLSQEFAEYSGLLQIETFRSAVVGIGSVTQQGYGSWSSALISSSETIGVNIVIANHTMIVRPYGSRGIYGVLRLPPLA